MLDKTQNQFASPHDTFLDDLANVELRLRRRFDGKHDALQIRKPIGERPARRPTEVQEKVVEDEPVFVFDAPVAQLAVIAW
jgi:hypothetical protein